MNEAQPSAPRLQPLLVEAFAVANLAFLGLDIALAHSVNEFAHPAEWIPLGFSGLAVVALLPGLLRRSYAVGANRVVGIGVGGVSIALGIAGMFLHVESTFFAEQSLKNLVSTAPFAAPLSYAGVGFLLLLNRMEQPSSPDWGPWVVFLSMAGFVGTFAVALGDHAQNGFFVALEWVPVASAALAASFLLVAALRPRDRAFLKLCLAVMAAQIAVGVAGFALHLRADLAGVSTSAWDNLIYGAPLFAPLLFPNLALLGAIGLWDALARP